MIEVVPFKVEHYDALTLQEGQTYVRDHLTPERAKTLEGPLAWSLVDGGRVLACGGVVEYWPGRGEAWALISNDCKSQFVGMVKAARRILDWCAVDRIEAAVSMGKGFHNGTRLLRFLGFDMGSSWFAPKYAPGGGHCRIYALVK